LRFDGDREILITQHRSAVLGMEHDAAVAHRPSAGVPSCLRADEAVLDAQTVVRERILVEEMPEAAVEGIVLVVADFEHTVLDAKRVGIIDAMFVTGDLGGRAIEVFRSEEHTSELQSRENLVCRLLPDE